MTSDKNEAAILPDTFKKTEVECTRKSSDLGGWRIWREPLKQGMSTSVLFALPVVLGGCFIPSFDVPVDENGPTIGTIYERITCELVEMIKDERPGRQPFKHRANLLAGNYVTTMNLSLEVADTGDLSPSLNFPSVTDKLAIHAGLKLGKTRTHNFTTKRRFSMVALSRRWQANKNFGICPEGPYGNLAGKLGITKLVELQFSAPNVDTATSIDKGGTFGGVITFIVTRGVNSVGPTWTLINFIGPGRLGKLERKTTNKLTIAFAPVDKIKEDKLTLADLTEADDFLRELLFSEKN